MENVFSKISFLDGGGPHGIRATSVDICVGSGGKVIEGRSYEFPKCRCGLISVERQNCWVAWGEESATIIGIILIIIVLYKKIVRI